MAMTLSGTGGITFNDASTQSTGKQACKAWVNYNGSTQTIRASYNISSITYSSAGIYVLNFTTAMPSVNYVVTGTSGNWGVSNSWIQVNQSVATASACTLASVTSGGASETTALQVAVFSS